ncbi:MAG: TrmH family RNA methyltransferase [Candidatus Gracilibacteria bacterium]|nr:TrmH family RNA methyltransferase [Candidatus Gracilibacteria bacterium]
MSCQIKSNKKYLLLDSIRSCLNVGAMMRTCDGAGFDKIILTGFTPIPPRKDIAKTAIGAEMMIDWEYYEYPLEIISQLKADGFKIVVLEQNENSIDYRKFNPDLSEDICIVLGNEIEGVRKEIIGLADYVIELPMLGKKQSLNVATAAGILMYKFV